MTNRTISFIYNKAQSHHSSDLIPSSYYEFRRAVDLAGAVRVKKRGTSTLLFDRDNQLIARTEAAGIDANGKCHATAYYVSGQDLLMAA